MVKLRNKPTEREWLEYQIESQRQWILEHGENLQGYVATYGSVKDFSHFGDGGEAIYRADFNQLQKLLENLDLAVVTEVIDS